MEFLALKMEQGSEVFSVFRAVMSTSAGETRPKKDEKRTFWVFFETFLSAIRTE